MVNQILYRLFVKPSDFEKTVTFYEQLFNRQCILRFRYPEVELELAQIENILIISGDDKAIEKFKQTQITMLVDSISKVREELIKLGAIILEEPKPVPTGYNMRVKHPDGLIVEYVEHVK